jgi:cyclic beta-1,2-glucan synthetase
VHVSASTHGLGRLIPFWSSANGNGRPRPASDDPPLRAELFTVEQLEKHALDFASGHDLAKGRAPDRLIRRQDENQRILCETYDLVTAAVAKGRRVAPAAEWLLDNFYLIEEQIRTARRHLPASYSRELPRLASGPAANFPRVYGIALELISHVDGRVDAVSLDAFIASYLLMRLSPPISTFSHSSSASCGLFQS